MARWPLRSVVYLEPPGSLDALKELPQGQTEGLGYGHQHG